MNFSPTRFTFEFLLKKYLPYRLMSVERANFNIYEEISRIRKFEDRYWDDAALIPFLFRVQPEKLVQKFDFSLENRDFSALLKESNSAVSPNLLFFFSGISLSSLNSTDTTLSFVQLSNTLDLKERLVIWNEPKSDRCNVQETSLESILKQVNPVSPNFSVSVFAIDFFDLSVWRSLSSSFFDVLKASPNNDNIDTSAIVLKVDEISAKIVEDIQLLSSFAKKVFEKNGGIFPFELVNEGEESDFAQYYFENYPEMVSMLNRKEKPVLSTANAVNTQLRIFKVYGFDNRLFSRNFKKFLTDQEILYFYGEIFAFNSRRELIDANVKYFVPVKSYLPYKREFEGFHVLYDINYFYDESDFVDLKSLDSPGKITPKDVRFLTPNGRILVINFRINELINLLRAYGKYDASNTLMFLIGAHGIDISDADHSIEISQKELEDLEDAYSTNPGAKVRGRRSEYTRIVLKN